MLLAARQDPTDDIGLSQLPTDGHSQPVLLDDDFDQVLNAAFARNARQVIYAALAHPDELEVRHLPADGSRPPETLYADAALVDIQWDRLAPLADAAIAFQTSQTTAGLCPGARVIRLGERLEGSLSSGTSDCYRLHLDETLDLVVSVRAGAALDAVVAVYDRTGNLISEDDDSGPGLNPRLHLHLDAPGTYSVVVRGYGAEAAGPYTLAIAEDQSVEPQQDARPLPVNERLRGAITVPMSSTSSPTTPTSTVSCMRSRHRPMTGPRSRCTPAPSAPAFIPPSSSSIARSCQSPMANPKAKAMHA